MGYVTEKEGESPVRGGPTPEEVREQLRTILASSAFNASKRCQQFLEYACEKSLAGESGTLKERTIAVDVFGRRPHSALGENTIVRVGAREVRKRLMQFYVSPEGVGSAIRIDLPSGCYVPEFRYAECLTMAELKGPAAASHAPAQAWRKYGILLLGAALLSFLGAAVLRQQVREAHKDVLDRFWEPALSSEEPLLLAVANPLVYRPSTRALRLSESTLPPSPIPMQRPLHVPPKDIDASDLIPVQNQYVAFGDLVATHKIATMLTARGKNVRLRKASSISFNDMRKEPVVLVGAITNNWTMELQTGWRYQFRYAPGSSTILLDTSDVPQDQRPQRQWSVTASDTESVQEDFVLICRLKNSATAGFLVVLAGVGQWGTEAAGRLVSEPEQLTAITHKLPAGWEDKNLQVVLRVRVIANAPGQPEVAASHVW